MRWRCPACCERYEKDDDLNACRCEVCSTWCVPARDGDGTFVRPPAKAPDLHCGCPTCSERQKDKGTIIIVDLPERERLMSLRDEDMN